MDRPDLVLLDVNETLSDLAPLRGRFEDVGATADLAATWFASVLRDGFALTAVGERASFADLGTAALRTLLDPAVLDRPVEEAVEHVMSGFMALAVHPDVDPGLRALHEAGVRLVTLSNGSAEVGRSLLQRAGLDAQVEAFLSVDDAGIWKPDPRSYRYALDVCDVPPQRAMLVAVHPWDLHGAHRAGLRTAWIDRAGRPYPSPFARPDVVARDFEELAARLT